MEDGSRSGKLDIKEGTIELRISVGKVNYSSNGTIPLFQANPQGGSIFILKDADNKIKFFYVYLGKGRTDVEYDVSKLDQDKKHVFVFTWSIKDREIKTYIDGELKSAAKINYQQA